VKDALITNAIVFETPISESSFSEKLIGKHLSEADTNYADRFVGKLAGKTADSCVGNVEMLFKIIDGEGINEPINYLSTCPLKWLKEDADKVTLKNKDETTTEIGANSCIFECKDLSAAANYLVTTVYTDGNSATSDYLPSTPLVSDLPDVIFTGLGGISIIDTTSGVDGTTEVDSTEIFIQSYEDKSSQTIEQEGIEAGTDELYIETAASKKESEDGDDQTNIDLPPKTQIDAVSQGSGACGANLSVSMPNGANILIQLLLAFGAIPMIRLGKRT
jgi:hypothetical protein